MPLTPHERQDQEGYKEPMGKDYTWIRSTDKAQGGSGAVPSP